MATLVLSAAGAAFGGSFGGSLAGLSTMAIGKAAGAILGNSIDQAVLGQGSATVDTGHVEQFRMMGASEGTVLPRAFGRVRLAGHLIWSSRFLEAVNQENVGGKGGGGTVREYSYSINLALAICEGEILRIGRIWADGQILDQSDLTIRIYPGTEDQIPDPLIQAIEGERAAPAYRGTAYVVIEGLPLGPFGNRIPQFNFEVYRRAEVIGAEANRHPALDVRGVALMPGTGEYTLATEPVKFARGKGEFSVTNVHNDRGIPDLKASLEQMRSELPNADAVSLVVSWFGNDLRCDRCKLRPAVEQRMEDGDKQPWVVAGQDRENAIEVGRRDGRPVFGGTPSDRSVIQSIEYMRSNGMRVMFYPFILMDILTGNGLEDPWTGEKEQPIIPWRGRITLSKAPGLPGSPDKSLEAAQEVSTFFGAARPEEFDLSGGLPVYHGPDGWTYRRFILHYAHLSVLAGGVDAFCIGSELRALTQIRSDDVSYPVVWELCSLASDVREILGANVKIGYAADWSEYFGHHPGDDSGDVFFHLDPLWSHEDIDFVGIDNYMPLSDWRDGNTHLDESYGSIYEIDYLKSNISGGEGYDWYYANAAAREAQTRLPITDSAYGEDWVFRYKDLVNWWSQPHFDRPGGARKNTPTGWIPESKPIWFTELGCPAVDKGTNQPNVFHDPKSSESALPYFSNGSQDEFIQARYLQAMFSYWGSGQKNPISKIYDGPMVDLSHAFVWAWDARPWPDFPGRLDTWIDGLNYELGHWFNGRAALCSLAQVVEEICERASMTSLDLSRLYGVVAGYSIQRVEDARQSLQPLMLAHGFDAAVQGEEISFASRGVLKGSKCEKDQLVASNSEPVISKTRGPAAETAGRVCFSYVRHDSDYAAGAVEAVSEAVTEARTSQTSLPLVLSDGQARLIAERWLAESFVGRETIEFSLPPSSLSLSVGDTLEIEAEGVHDLYRVDRVEEMGHRPVTATRIERGLYSRTAPVSRKRNYRATHAPTPVHVELLDLPLLTGEELPHSLHVAATKKPWAGPVAVYESSRNESYSLNKTLPRSATIGELIDDLSGGQCGRWAPVAFRVKLTTGALERRAAQDVLNGANVAAIRPEGAVDWELIQFRDADLDPDIQNPGVYRIRNILRGQAGTDGSTLGVLPAGSAFVLLDGAVRQLQLPSSTIGLERHYRVGPIAKPYDAPAYVHVIETSKGVGLRPFRPVHISAILQEDGSIEFQWVRRTRQDGDSWAGSDVPLGEENETYHFRIVDADRTLREFSPNKPRILYSSADQREDGGPSELTAEVAQISTRYGPGPYARASFKIDSLKRA